MSHTLQLTGLQQARLLSPSLLSAVCRNSCPLNWWFYPTISSSVALFSSCLKSFLASGCFPLSWLFASGSQSLEFQLQHQSFQWIFRVDFLWHWLVGSPWVHGTLKSLLQHHSSKASILQSSAFKEKREKGAFLHYWWECNLIQSLWRTVSRFLKKLENKTIKWPSNPTTGHILWGNHNWKGHMYPSIHRSNIDNSQDMDTTYMNG